MWIIYYEDLLSFCQQLAWFSNMLAGHLFTGKEVDYLHS